MGDSTRKKFGDLMTRNVGDLPRNGSCSESVI